MVAPQGRKFAGPAVGDENAFTEAQAPDAAPRSSSYLEPEQEEEIRQALDNRTKVPIGHPPHPRNDNTDSQP